MQKQYKIESNSLAASPNAKNEDLILSRNKSLSIQRRLKSNSQQQIKLQSIRNQINASEVINDSFISKTTRESNQRLNNDHTFKGLKNQSLHISQSSNSNQQKNYYLINGQQSSFHNENDAKIFQNQSLLKHANFSYNGLLHPASSGHNQQLNMSFVSTNYEEIQQMKSSLQNLIQKEEDIFRGLQHRSNKLTDIVSIFGSPEQFHFANENDFNKFRDAVQELSLTLVTAAKNEIELGAKSREIERLNLENKLLIRKHSTLKEKIQEQQKVNELISQRNKQILEENNKFLILLNTEKKDNRINTKKVSALEKRVEFILENEVNVTLNPNDKLRQSLNELLRENESLKRDLAHKNQEIERNMGNIKRMNDIIARLNSKIESMKKDPSKFIDSTSSSILKQEIKQNKETGESTYIPQNAKINKNDDIDLFSNFVIPSNLDFRIISLKSDHQNLILDLVEVGKYINIFSFFKLTFFLQFCEILKQACIIKIYINKTYVVQIRRIKFYQINNVDKQFNLIKRCNIIKLICNLLMGNFLNEQVFNLLANQFLSFKEISEKVNLLLNDLSILFSDKDIKKVIPELNLSLQQIFNARQAHVWLVDCQQGVKQIQMKELKSQVYLNYKQILVTYENAAEKKCLISKGILSESFFAKKPINSKNSRNKALYYSLSEDKELQVMVDTCMVIPIFELNNNQVKMIIEISNSKNEIFSFDEEYLSIIIGNYLNNIITLKQQAKIQESIIKFNQQLFETFDDLMYSQNKFDLAKKVQKQIGLCFGITNFIFYFVEDEQLVKYENASRSSKYSLKHGLAGQAVIDQKPYIISDAKLSSYYNKLVDLQSILPILAIPLLDKFYISQSTEENPISGCLGVIELALKQKYKSTKTDILIDASEGYFGLEEAVSAKIQYFCQLIVHAIKQINSIQSKTK